MFVSSDAIKDKRAQARALFYQKSYEPAFFLPCFLSNQTQFLFPLTFLKIHTFQKNGKVFLKQQIQGIVHHGYNYIFAISTITHKGAI